MTKNMTLSEQRTLLLDFLSDKTLEFGCIFQFEEAYGGEDDLRFLKQYWDTGNTCTIEYCPPEDSCCGSFNNEEDNFTSIKIIGKPVMINDIFQKIKENNNLRTLKNYEELMVKWNKFNFTDSLNEILKSEIIPISKEIDPSGQAYYSAYVGSLHNFLWNMFKSEIKK